MSETLIQRLITRWPIYGGAFHLTAAFSFRFSSLCPLYFLFCCCRLLRCCCCCRFFVVVQPFSLLSLDGSNQAILPHFIKCSAAIFGFWGQTKTHSSSFWLRCAATARSLESFIFVNAIRHRPPSPMFSSYFMHCTHAPTGAPTWIEKRERKRSENYDARDKVRRHVSDVTSSGRLTFNV